MTRSQLPEITLTCGNGHRFTTRAAGGQTVRCKTCSRSKHVPTDRPRTAKEAASYAAPGVDGHQDQDQAADAEPDPARELADRWQRETPWSGSIRMAPARPGDECPKCEGPLSWEPRRTLVYCPACERIDLPPAVAAYHDRQQAQRATVAVRQGATVSVPAGPAARARLRALKIQAEEWAEDWIDSIGDPDSYDRIQWEREASTFTAAMRGWIPELKNAETEAELAEVKRTIIAELIDSQPGKELRAEYDASLNRAEQAEQRRQYAEEKAQREAEREAAEAAEAARRQAEYQRRQRELAKPPAPRAITVSPKPPDAVAIIGELLEQNRKNKAERAARIERNGKCGWCRKPTPATRAYGAGYQQGGWGFDRGLTLALDRPHARACSKHYEQAGQHAEQQNPGITTYYWELT